MTKAQATALWRRKLDRKRGKAKRWLWKGLEVRFDYYRLLHEG